MHALRTCGKYVLAAATSLAALASLGTAHAGIVVLLTFNGSDGGTPNGVIEDSAGNLYGTTFEGGGGGGARCNDEGCGTVFKLAPDGTETVLYSFTATGDGAYPEAGVILDKAGNLYGTTSGSESSAGNVFKLAPDGTETVLHAFHGSDGAWPMGGVVRDRRGNLYGTTSAGGDPNCEPRGGGCGSVFKLAPGGTETVLHVFTGGSDGANPFAGLIRDKAGNLYGTTYSGGARNAGTVFKLAPDGTETVLYAFPDSSDGGVPGAALIQDSAGNLYGTTEFGGDYGDGTVFRLAPDGSETVLHSFTGGRDGNWPLASLIEDRAGNLYGTTALGGNLKCELNYSIGCGTVFRLAPDGIETVLHAFHGRKDGFLPDAGLVMDRTGRLYGTASMGSGIPTKIRENCFNIDGCGTVFRLKK